MCFVGGRDGVGVKKREVYFRNRVYFSFLVRLSLEPFFRDLLHLKRSEI